MISHHHASLVFAAAVALSLVGAASRGADVALTTTIPSPAFSPIIPPPAPQDTVQGVRVGARGEFIDLGVKLFAKAMMQQDFKRALAEGVSRAQKSGQAGVLLNVRYAENRDATDRWVPGGPVGGGVTVVGIGPDPGSICFVSRCDQTLSEALNPTAARRYTSESDYYWVGDAPAPRKGQYVIARYGRAELESWTRMVSLDAAASQALTREANTRIVDGLAKKVEAETKGKAQQAEIQRILTSREEAKKELARVEDELRRELIRQEERQKTMATLQVMRWALDAASIANTERVAQQGAAATTPSLEQQVKDGAVRIDVLRDRSAQWSNKLDGSTTLLMERVVQLTVPAPPMAPTTVKPTR